MREMGPRVAYHYLRVQERFIRSDRDGLEGRFNPLIKLSVRLAPLSAMITTAKFMLDYTDKLMSKNCY